MLSEGQTFEVRLVQSIGCSFAAGTLVTAEAGALPIDKLKPGDKVYARNEQTGEQSYHPVTQTFATPNDELYNLTLTSTSGKQETLGVTGNHPFWGKDKGWTESDLLKSGMQVAGKDGGWLKVAGLTLRAGRATGYNLEVEDDHSYFVGDSQAWVHNECLVAKGASELSFGRKLDFLSNKGIDQSNAYNAARAAGNAKRIGLADTAVNRAEVAKLFNQAYRDPSFIVEPGKVLGSNLREFFLPGVTGTGSKIQFIEKDGQVLTIIAK